MSDTKETEGYTTVELTLDNDEVSNVQSSQYMKLQARNTLPCCLWTKILSRMKLVMFIFISIMKPRTANLTSATLKTMKNMKIAADAFDEWMDSQEFDESDIEE